MAKRHKLSQLRDGRLRSVIDKAERFCEMYAGPEKKACKSGVFEAEAGLETFRTCMNGERGDKMGQCMAGLTPRDIEAAEASAKNVCDRSFSKAEKRVGCYVGVEQMVREMAKIKPSLSGKKRKKKGAY